MADFAVFLVLPKYTSDYWASWSFFYPADVCSIYALIGVAYVIYSLYLLLLLPVHVKLIY